MPRLSNSKVVHSHRLLLSILIFFFCCAHAYAYNLRTTPSPNTNSIRKEVEGGLLGSTTPRSTVSVGRRQIVGEFSLLALLSPLFLLSSPASALSPEEAATAYDSYAETYNDLDGGTASSLLGIEEARFALFRQARGSVLEIGAGTGLNLGKYDLDRISSITLLDISDGMLREAKKRVSSSPELDKISVRFVKADATSDLVDIFGASSFDTVVDSFSLCVMGNEGAKRCLDQVRQVVKSKDEGGK
jgi:hypothetical protein